MTTYSVDADRKYDLYSQEAKRNAHAIYAQMRQDDPVYCQLGMDGSSMIWWITKHADVDRVLKDNQTFVRDWRLVYPPDGEADNGGVWSLLDNHMLNKDGADHKRLRNLVSKAFTPKIVRSLRPRVEAIANELIDNALAVGQMDLVADYAFHLPTIVISELLGIPAEDREKFKVWTNAVLTPTFDAASNQQAMAHIQAFVVYLQTLFAERRRNPQADFVTDLIEAEEDGDRLSESELFSMMFLLIIAGHETTVNLIGNSMMALWQHPEQLAQLKADNGLIKTAVEELIRYDGSVERALARWTTRDVEIDGQTIPKGATVIVVLGSANRDTAVFDEPDILDITRPINPHLGFGKGAHYCLGAPLARLETEVALTTLLTRLPNLQPAIALDELRWRNLPGFRGLQQLPVTW